MQVASICTHTQWCITIPFNTTLLNECAIGYIICQTQNVSIARVLMANEHRNQLIVITKRSG